MSTLVQKMGPVLVQDFGSSPVGETFSKAQGESSDYINTTVALGDRVNNLQGRVARMTDAFLV